MYGRRTTIRRRYTRRPFRSLYNRRPSYRRRRYF